ncbi:MAG: extracellular solute-binding protein, partial [Dehalococcoidia bacterium]
MRKIHYRRLTRRRAVVGLLSIFAVIILVAAACGEEATPTPIPATSTPVPGATATPRPAATATPRPAATATPVPGATATPRPAATATPRPAATATPTAPGGLRPLSEWTVANPATLAEIEAELEKFRGDTLVFVSWGGAYQGAQRQAYIEPFEAQFGIDILEESPVEYPKIRAMSEVGNVTWHVVDVGHRATFQFGATGDLEELDFSIIDNRDMLEVMKTPWNGGPGLTWSTVLAYSTETYPEGSQPRTWADFFDVDKFPGRRGWRNNMHAAFTFALLGLHPDWLDDPAKRLLLGAPTPELVDEAMVFWEAWKPNVDIWWHTGSDCPQLLISGELDMCTAWNGRIFDAQKEGAPLAIAWEAGHLLSTDGWVTPNGLSTQDPEKFELAQLFMAWSTFPETAARIGMFISYGPGNAAAIPFLAGPAYDESRDELPSSAKNIVFAVLEDEGHTG